MTRYPWHAHKCDRCGTATVGCNAPPERDESGRYCPGDAHPEQYVCEDCDGLEYCEGCGAWVPGESLTDKGRVLMCPTCLEDDMADEDEVTGVAFDPPFSPAKERGSPIGINIL